ncbi:MAG: hypothetical protein WBG42_07555 [Cryomorphaceae bacterium]
MNLVQEKQNRIINEIKKIKDLDFLESLEMMLSNKTNTYTLSEEKLRLVEESQGQIKSGNSKSHKELIEEMKRWLSEK